MKRLLAGAVAVVALMTAGAATADSGGWTEVGRIDELGHKLGVELAGSLDEQVERIARRVADLLGRVGGQVELHPAPAETALAAAEVDQLSLVEQFVA